MLIWIDEKECERQYTKVDTIIGFTGVEWVVMMAMQVGMAIDGDIDLKFNPITQMNENENHTIDVVRPERAEKKKTQDRDRAKKYQLTQLHTRDPIPVRAVCFGGDATVKLSRKQRKRGCC